MASADSSVLGCRVSVISKAQIRYEGILESVDFEAPNEPVATLCNVWAFGTEERPCPRPFPPSNEEYAKVVFRGRDLLDLKVVTPSNCMNEDSAIVSAVPVSNSSSHPPGLMSNDNKNRLDQFTNIRSPEPSNTTFPQPFSLDNYSRTGTPSQQLTSTGSRSSAVISENFHKTDSNGPRPFGDVHNDDQTFYNVNKKYVGVRSGHELSSDTGKISSNSNPWSNRDQGYKKSAMYKSSNSYADGHDYSRDKRGGYNSYYSNNRGNREATHQWNGRGGGNQAWSRFRNPISQNTAPTKFSDEYDIEKANAELAVELEKISINVKPGTTCSSEKSDDNSNGSTSADATACYDQNKSFFDTISSEMMDRANGVNPQGMKRRDERSLNSATFGMVLNQYPKRIGYNGGSRQFGYGTRRMGNSSGGNYWKSGNASYNKGFTHNSSHSPLTTGRAI